MSKNQSPSQAAHDHAHLVVGVDGADPSHAALLWAAAEATRRGLPLHILHVEQLRSGQLPLGAAVGEVSSIVEENSQAVLHKAVTAAQAAHPDLEVVPMSIEGQPSRQLIKASKDAALVVIGSHGKHKAPHAALGTTAFTTATHAHSPVVVVHPDRRCAHPGGPAKVVVGVDGSKSSARALDFAIAAAGPAGTVDAVYAWWFDVAESEAISGGDEVIEQRIRDQRMDKVRAFVADAAAAHPEVTVNAVSVQGAPSHVLDQRSQEADLLVVGIRGKGGFGGLMLGSTAMKMLIGSPVPVAVTPR